MKRTEEVKIRLTPYEKQMIDISAKKNGLPIATYIRLLCINAERDG